MKQRYGPWAVLVGGSEGIGEHLARQLAAAGVNLVLVARKPEALAAAAANVRGESGVAVRTLELDVTRPDMLERVAEVTEGLEVGLLVHNVGGGYSPGPFVAKSADEVMIPVLANVVALTRLAHHFGAPMAERGRGGILMIGSLAGNAGSFWLVGYSAAKAYVQTFAEGLWAELQPQGVDVLCMPVGAADTPSRRRSGTVDDDGMVVARAEDVARQALERLPHGPVYTAPENEAYFRSLCAMPRREAAELQRDLLMRMLPG